MLKDSILGRQAPVETTAGWWVEADTGKTNPRKESEGTKGDKAVGWTMGPSEVNQVLCWLWVFLPATLWNSL